MSHSAKTEKYCQDVDRYSRCSMEVATAQPSSEVKVVLKSTEDPYSRYLGISINEKLDSDWWENGNYTCNYLVSSDYYDYNAQIRRSLYIDNVLYTLSGNMIKMNDLSDLREINKVDLPIEQEIYPVRMA